MLAGVRTLLSPINCGLEGADRQMLPLERDLATPKQILVWFVEGWVEMGGRVAGESSQKKR